MKFLLPLLTLTFVSINAQADLCRGRARIIAPIKSTELFKVGYCRVFLEPSEVKYYAPSEDCPLSLEEISTEGVISGFSNGWECRFEPDDEFNGSVVRDPRGFLKADGFRI